MNLTEYNKVQACNYLEYCKYLHEKYGIPKYNYMTKSYNKVQKITRTNEGLIAHHIYENRAIMLSTKEIAMHSPYEWQLAENIVYCDYLEHLFLHILITENPCTDEPKYGTVGIGGVVNFIVPELNDYYSGWVTNQKWRINCHELIKNDKNMYLLLIGRFKQNCSNHYNYDEEKLYRSYNEQYGLWDSIKNKKIYKELKKT